MQESAEALACIPTPVEARNLDPAAAIPYGCTPEHIFKAMREFTDFLGFINQQLHSHQLPRLESFLMPANFSSMVGEFMAMTIPKHCASVVRNRYHNGHPDLIPSNTFEHDAVQHATQGIEVKASRYRTGWQGHNAEETWLMVFVFDCNGPQDQAKGIPPKPFTFVTVAGAQLVKDDWQFSGRSETSRRTITASVKASGYAKMMANWIYAHSVK